MPTLAHISDLHLGLSPDKRRQTAALCDALRAHAVDHVVLTGDVTEHGREEEFDEAKQLFQEFLDAGCLTILPGNHDHLRDNVAKKMMHGQSVMVVQRQGLSLFCLNTTGPHNRYTLTCHGKISEKMLDEVDRHIAATNPRDLIVVALHHHPLPLPEERWYEKISSFFRLPYAKEIALGQTLLERLRGRCDLVLHGHRHTPREILFHDQGRTLTVYNGGSSTTLGRFRIFTHQDGHLIAPPIWVET